MIFYRSGMMVMIVVISTFLTMWHLHQYFSFLLSHHSFNSQCVYMQVKNRNLWIWIENFSINYSIITLKFTKNMSYIFRILANEKTSLNITCLSHHDPEIFVFCCISCCSIAWNVFCCTSKYTC